MTSLVTLRALFHIVFYVHQTSQSRVLLFEKDIPLSDRCQVIIRVKGAIVGFQGSSNSSDIISLLAKKTLNRPLTRRTDFAYL